MVLADMLRLASGVQCRPRIAYIALFPLDGHSEGELGLVLHIVLHPALRAERMQQLTAHCNSTPKRIADRAPHYRCRCDSRELTATSHARRISDRQVCIVSAFKHCVSSSKRSACYEPHQRLNGILETWRRCSNVRMYVVHTALNSAENSKCTAKFLETFAAAWRQYWRWTCA